MSDDNVVDFDGYTVGDVPVEKVLDGAKEGIKGEVVIIGEGVEDMLYFASSSGDATKVLWLLEQAKLRLLETT